MQIVYQRMKSLDQSSNHLVIQKGDGNAESDVNSRHPDVQGHPMSVSKLSMLFTATTEEENPDHGEWDTDVM